MSSYSFMIYSRAEINFLLVFSQLVYNKNKQF